MINSKFETHPCHEVKDARKDHVDRNNYAEHGRLVEVLRRDLDRLKRTDEKFVHAFHPRASTNEEQANQKVLSTHQCVQVRPQRLQCRVRVVDQGQDGIQEVLENCRVIRREERMKIIQ